MWGTSSNKLKMYFGSKNVLTLNHFANSSPNAENLKKHSSNVSHSRSDFFPKQNTILIFDKRIVKICQKLKYDDGFLTYQQDIFLKSLHQTNIFFRMVFCFRNCSDLLWEKNTLAIKKNFWNSRLKAKNLQKLWYQTVKGQTNFWNRKIFKLLTGGFSDQI